MQLVEARLGWGADALGVAHVRARSGCLNTADFGLPFPDGEVFQVSELPRTFTAGGLVLSLSLVDSVARIPAAKTDWRVAKGVALALVIHTTFLAMAFIGRGSDVELERAQLEDLKTLLDAQQERVGVLKVQAETMPGEQIGDSDGATNGLAEGGDEGKMGSTASQKTGGVAQKSKGVKPHATDPRPEPSVESFGMIALLSENGAGQNAGNDSFATHEGPSALGSIFGAHIDDAIGTGGMGLSGMGEAGGGYGAGIDAPLSGLGRGGGCGPGCEGVYRSTSRIGGYHVAKAPVLRCGGDDGCMVQVNGRLPPEAVQRVVRQNFGRLRACYESGLQRDPSLEGRIAVKFVIDRAGAVTMASVDERSLPDAEVARCVARGFENMSFPQPEGGVVTVLYPVVFSLM